MNKLISRNPVQRFKQGRKIVKALGGLDDTFKLLSDTAERTAEREQYWAEEEARKARAAYDRQMKSNNNNSPKFYGQTVGGKVLARGSNFNGLINDSQKQALLNAGFKNEDFNDVLSFQKALNNFFLKDGAGSIKVDDKWGNQTQKAFDLALSKAGYDPSNKKALTPTTISNIYNQNRLEGLYAAGLLKKPESLTISENSLPTINTKIRGGNFNKSQIRDLIREGGFNPYAYTGAQRRALRLYLNGLSDDTSLLDGTDLARFTLPFRKKGGTLLSRNVIERFKQGKAIRKMQNASGGPLWEKRTHVPYGSDFDGNIYVGSWNDQETGISGSPIVINDAIMRQEMTPEYPQETVPYDSKNSYASQNKKYVVSQPATQNTQSSKEESKKVMEEQPKQQNTKKGSSKKKQVKSKKLKKATQIQEEMPFESTTKSYTIDLSQIPETGGITISNQPKEPAQLPIIDTSKMSYSRKFYNKSDVRDYMRRIGINPYSYTADYRIALRNVLNGQGTEHDYNMVKAMGIKQFKQGGLLPSRNIIERFKNRNFIQVDQ